MNLRTVTIWTTGVMLVATFILPCVFWIIAPTLSSATLATFSFVWFASGSPLVVSLILTIVLRYHISSIILSVSTIAYGIWYIHTLPTVFFEFMGVFVLLYIGILSLPVMIPAWITAFVLDRRYRKNQTEP